VTPVACQGISLLTATPNRPGPARNLFRFRDQECSHFVITNIRRPESNKASTAPMLWQYDSYRCGDCQTSPEP